MRERKKGDLAMLDGTLVEFHSWRLTPNHPDHMTFTERWRAKVWLPSGRLVYALPFQLKELDVLTKLATIPGSRLSRLRAYLWKWAKRWWWRTLRSPFAKVRL